jgi:tetratricopeptide (TPR) repeat protein
MELEDNEADRFRLILKIVARGAVRSGPESDRERARARMERHDPETKWFRCTWVRCAKVVVLCGGLVLFSGCGWIVQLTQNSRLRGYDNDINNAAEAIAKAHGNAELAGAYSARGSAYAEKARYSRGFKLISAAEYQRLFDLAMKDHDQAIALNPASPDVYYNRGKAYWDKGTAEEAEHLAFKASFDHAAADFEISTERDPKNFMTFDMLGLSRESNGEWDEAIKDYSRELSLNPKLGTERLAGAYCGRGQEDSRKMDLMAATADYEKSVELDDKTDDGCSCEPYNALLVVYTDTKQYDKAWVFVHRSQQSKHWLDGELVNRLKKASGRNS